MKELKRIILVFVAIVISIQSVYATNSRIAYDHNLKEKAISEMTEAEKEIYYDSLLLDENGNELETEELSTTEQYEAYYDRNNVPVKDVKETETMAYQFNKYVDDNYDEKRLTRTIYYLSCM